MRSSRTFLRLLAPVLAAGLVLSACGGSDEPDSPDETPAAKKEPATWPLTGLAAKKGENVETKHPVYIAKIDNTPDSDPQYALGQSDMITEELVEGGITRLAVFYHSQLPTKVGPLRSMRATDVGIASPVDAQIMTSGAAPYTYNALQKAGIKWIGMGNPNVVRLTDGTHDSLHSVVGNLKGVAKNAKMKPTRPKDYFPWGDEKDFPGRKKAKSISATFSTYRTSQFAYRGGKYTMTDGYAAAGDEFKPSTVVVAQVRTSIAPYKDPSGADVPVSHFEGKGKAWVFHGGRLQKANWIKKTESSSVKFETKSGDKLAIPAGKVYLALVPQDGGSVTFK